jgi:serine/threonine-protein kinase HipA
VKLDVQVLGKRIAQLYREGDEYVLKYLPEAQPSDFVSACDRGVSNRG